MNNPVLLPKRKEYGFLKPPSTPSQHSVYLRRIGAPRSNRSNNTARSNNTINHFNTNKPISSPDDSELPYTNAVNYLIDPLQLKYEIKNGFMGNRPAGSFARSKTCHPSSVTHSQNGFVGSALKKKSFNNSNIYRQTKNDLRKVHSDRQAYTTESGTNFVNQTKDHKIMNIPFNRFDSSSYDIIGPDVTGSDTGFVASRMMVKREKTSINNCPKCGKLYYDFKCLNCQFAKKKFTFKWRPMNLRPDPIGLEKNKFPGYLSKSTSALDKQLDLMKTPSLNRSIINEPIISGGNLTKSNLSFQKFDKQHTSRLDLASMSDNKEVKFKEFDMGFKFDVESAMNLNNPPKLTLYLV